MINAEAAVKWGLPWMNRRFTTSATFNTSNVSDPAYDAMHEAALAATTIEELHRLSREMNQYAIEKFWQIWGGMAPKYDTIQPWVKGFNGEYYVGNAQGATVFTRLWIDQDLKKEMGH